MYTAKAFLLSLVVLAISHQVTSQAIPGFGSGSFGGFQIPGFPSFGGENSNSPNSGFFGLPFFPQFPQFPGFPQLPFFPGRPRPSSTTTEGSTTTTLGSSTTTEAETTASGRRRRDAEDIDDEDVSSFVLPNQDGPSAPSQQPSQQSEQAAPGQHHDRFLDFHFHRGRRAAAVAGN